MTEMTLDGSAGTPPPKSLTNVSVFKEIIEHRRSIRIYDGTPCLPP